jgi:hypothetical protein
MIYNNRNTQDAYDCNGVIPYLPTPSLSRSRRVQQRQQYQSHRCVAMANEAISALNHLATSFVGTSDHISPLTNNAISQTTSSFFISTGAAACVYSCYAILPPFTATSSY